jgi:hypothetical protein
MHAQCCQSVGFYPNTLDLLFSLQIVGLMAITVGFWVHPWLYFQQRLQIDLTHAHPLTRLEGVAIYHVTVLECDTLSFFGQGWL